MPSGFISLDAELGWPGSFGEHWDIVGVQFGHRTEWQLRLEISTLGGIDHAVIFADPVSFRVQDEGDILNYWADRAKEGAANANIYSIANSAYLDEIGHGVNVQTLGPVSHFLMGGQNTCVEVIGRSPPTLL